MTLDHQQEERVRSAFAALTDSTPLGAEFDELADHDSTLPVHPGTSERPMRGLAYMLAAAMAVLAVGSLAFLTTQTAPEGPVLSQPALTEPNPTTDSESDLLNPVWCEAPSTWTRVCDDAAGFEGAVMSSVTVGGPGLVAVGAADDDAAVWTSPDGFTWSRVPHDESVFAGVVDTDMLSLAAGGPGLVAVGSDGDDAAVWTSPDGFTWSRVPYDEAVFGGDLHQRMLSVTVAGPGLVAVGTDGTQFPYDGNNHDAVAAVWTSPDGFTWSRVPHDESVFGGNGEQVMESVTVGGPGLVAVGWDGADGGALNSCCEWTPDDPTVAAVWTSPDGFTWSRVRHDESVFGGDIVQAMFSVTVGGSGLVAVGAADDDAAVWNSPDGFTWSRIAHDPAVFGGSSGDSSREWMASVIASGPGLVAVGSSGPVPRWPIEEAVWTSPDGIAWTRLPQSQHGCYAEMSSVTIGFFGPVAVGFAADCGPDTAAVWHG